MRASTIALGGQRRLSNLLELDLKVVASHLGRMLCIKLKSSTRAISTLNRRVISPAWELLNQQCFIIFHKVGPQYSLTKFYVFIAT